MRRARYRHLWPPLRRVLAAALLLALIPLSLAGSLLVWRPAIDATLHPARATSGQAARLAPDAYAATAAAQLRPDERIAAVDLAGPGPVLLKTTAATDDGIGVPAATLYLDPATARLLDRDDRRDGPLPSLRRFHDRLLLAHGGAAVIGALGVAMLIALLAGWWRRAGTAPWARIAGALVAVPLALLLASGIWLAFPAFFGSLVGEATVPAAATAAPLGEPALGADAALARAAPYGVGALRLVEWPTEHRPDWRFVFAGGAVSVADDSAAVAPARPRLDEPVATSLTALLRRLHGGADMPWWWRILLTLAGLIPLGIALRWVRPRRRRRRA